MPDGTGITSSKRPISCRSLPKLRAPVVKLPPLPVKQKVKKHREASAVGRLFLVACLCAFAFAILRSFQQEEPQVEERPKFMLFRPGHLFNREQKLSAPRGDENLVQRLRLLPRALRPERQVQERSKFMPFRPGHLFNRKFNREQKFLAPRGDEDVVPDLLFRLYL